MRQRISFITGNKSKFREAKSIFDDMEIELAWESMELSEPQTTDQEAVVLAKAREAYAKLKRPVLVDDTGIYFEEYDNFPGTSTKILFETIGFRGIERLLAGANRNAYFRTLICYKDRKTEKVFEGIWHGRIVDSVSKSFNPDWQYNSIFIPADCSRPLSEIPLEERAEKSHRRKAFDKIISHFGGVQDE